MLFILLLACTDAPEFAPAQPWTMARVGEPTRVVWDPILYPSAGEVADWGESIAVGDFNGDGVPELIVQGVNTRFNGHYYDLYESNLRRFDLSNGVVAVQTLALSSAGGAWTDRREGAPMIAVDYNADGYDDLVALDVGLWGSFDVDYRYRFLVRYGSATGLGAVTASFTDDDGIGGAYGGPRYYRLFPVHDASGTGRDSVAVSGPAVDDQFRLVKNPVWISLTQYILADLGLEGELDVSAELALDVDGDGQDEPWLSVNTLGSTARRSIESRSLGWVSANPWHGPVQWFAHTDRTQPLSEHGPTHITGFADVSLDGLPDLILSPDGQDRSVHVHLGVPGGGVDPVPLRLPLEASDRIPVATRQTNGQYGAVPRFVLQPSDFDGDGLLDILVLTDTARLYRWSAAAGGPSPVPTEVFDLDVGKTPNSAAVADFNMDGAADLVVGTSNTPSHIVTDGVRVVWGGVGAACPGGGERVVAFDDADGDGHASTSHAGWWCTPPASSQPTPGDDCDDDDVRVYPGSTEVIGGIDVDCDGWVSCLLDQDDDGYGHLPVSAPGFACADGGRRLVSPQQGGDCDDLDDRARPTATDVAGYGDYSCDGIGSCLTDADGDGVGADPINVPIASGVACPPEHPDPSQGTDCAPTDPAYDTVQDWYSDQDGDGALGLTETVCVPTLGVVTVLPGPEDCDDANPVVYPGAPEALVGEDSDWDGLDLCWFDDDGDDWGGDTTVESTAGCRAADVSLLGGDCDDTNWRAYPGKAYFHNTYDMLTDHDCDGTLLCYVDEDLDGSGGLVRGESASCLDAGFDIDDADCDDSDPTLSPYLPEDPATPWDDNCNGATSMVVVNYASLYSVRGVLSQPVDQAVLDAPPGQTIYLLRAKNRALNAFCPPALGGACLDLVNPSLVESSVSNPTGSAPFRMAVYPWRDVGLVRRYVQATTITGVQSATLAGFAPGR